LYSILIYFLFLLGLQPNFVFNWLHIDCANIIEHIKLQVQ
jgi:NADH:ubiquinone oxidoreductase subunit 4 (subunit M)